MSVSDSVSAQEADVRQQYLQHFDPVVFRDTYYHSGVDDDVAFVLRCYHDAFNKGEDMLWSLYLTYLYDKM